MNASDRFARLFVQPTEQDAFVAWRAALVGAVTAACAEIAVFTIGSTSVPAPFVTLRIAHGGWSLAVAAVLVVRRRAPTVRLAELAMTAIVVPLFPIFWLAHESYIASGRPFVLLAGPKLAITIVALLDPAVAPDGMLLIFAIAIESIAIWFGLDAFRLPSASSSFEPTLTVIYAIVGIVVLVNRATRRVVDRENARILAEARAAERLANVALALRDRANTPLQTLEVVTAVLERRHPEERTAIERMRRALAVLGELSRAMARYEAAATWRKGAESFDAGAVLRGDARETGGPDTPHHG